MRYEEQKQYLKAVGLLEKQLAIYQDIAHCYAKNIQKLEKEMNTVFLYEWEERTEKRAHRTNYEMPAPEYKPRYLGDRKNKKGRRVPVYGFVGVTEMFYRLPHRWWDKEMYALERQERNKYRRFHIASLLLALAIGGGAYLLSKQILSLVFCVILGIVACIYVGNEKKKEYLPGNSFYEKYMELYAKKYQADLKRKSKEYAPQLQALQEEYRTQIIAKQRKSKTLLETLYAKEVLEEEFRNYAAVVQLYEYFETGRCSTLEETKQLYKEELAEGVITNDLQLSIYRLEKWKDSMGSMLRELKYKEEVVEKIKSQLLNDEKRVELHEFNGRCDRDNEKIEKEYALAVTKV